MRIMTRSGRLSSHHLFFCSTSLGLSLDLGGLSRTGIKRSGPLKYRELAAGRAASFNLLT